MAGPVIEWAEDFIGEFMSTGGIGQFFRSQQAPSDCRMAEHEPDPLRRVNKHFECEWLNSQKKNIEDMIIITFIMVVLLLAIFFGARWALRMTVNHYVSQQSSQNQTNIQLVDTGATKLKGRNKPAHSSIDLEGFL